MAGGLAGKIKRVAQRVSRTVTNRALHRRILQESAPSAKPLDELPRYEMKVYSQHGEDGIFEAIFARIGTTKKYCVEFGIGTGKECNTRHLIECRGWTGLWMTGNEFPRHRKMEIRREFVTAENINTLFEKYGVPHEFDLLNIDIDGNDYWVWKNITAYRPRVVCMEYNAHIPPTQSRVIAYDPKFIWGRTDYYGASLLALAKLGQAKGYELIGCDSSGTNAFFVERSLAGNFARKSVEEHYRAGKKLRHDERKMIEV